MDVDEGSNLEENSSVPIEIKSHQNEVKVEG